MDGNTFGKLVRAYREQRGWKQQELAEHWGFTREYVSQVERGKRKLDKQEQVTRLADILGIPQERLEAVGKGGSPRKTSVQNSLEGDDILLQAFLEPTQTAVKISWLIWQGDGVVVDMGKTLKIWEDRLNGALGRYHGQFRNPALRLLAYIHEMRGKLAIERTATKEAVSHFQEMYDIAEELGDPDLFALALIHQSEMFRRRGRYEAAFRRIEAAETYVKKYGEEVSRHIQGVLWKAYAINYFVYGNEQGFLRTIDRAAAIAEDMVTTADSLSSEFDKVEVLQVKAHGHTQLWKPEKALEIYRETDRLRPFRTFRDQSSYQIVKAQAYCYVGDIKKGIEHAMKGLKMAEDLDSIRYVIRLQQMSDRLSVTPIGKEHAMKDLQGEVLGTLERMHN